ncbi:MAG: carboxypeptidase regulatory-like domain-containing protein [Candidatus Dadabacteria bacterium]|nr:carboxypeptidase regulatory-like domain-containing protein [Candidatus Dadabacteria bacterium]
MKKVLSSLIALVALFAFSFIINWNLHDAKGKPPGPGLPIDADDIGGQVVSSDGPEAGVWVIAETDALPTKFRKIVVTDDDGNFVVPDLPALPKPNAKYDVWVRGYGLADSRPIQASPGDTIALVANIAATPQEAAEVYPANYWYSLLEPPAESMFPGTGPIVDGGNGIPTSYPDQESWVNQIKLMCELCHQMGNEATRSLPTVGAFDAGLKKAGFMDMIATGLGREVALEVFGDWLERIAAGEVPPEPPRPQGIERNFVITQWEWGDRFAYVHDEIATDKRDPYLYPYGKVYGMDIGMDRLLAVDPVTNEVFEWDVPTRGGFNTPWCKQPGFCTWKVYHNPANPHNPMMDDTGKVWMTTQIRATTLSDYCLDIDPAIRPSRRGLGFFDTVTEEFALIDTCYGTHHLQFDSDGVLWTSGDSRVFGWLDPSLLDLGDCGIESCPSEQVAQGWFRVVVDSDGDGVADTPMPGSNYGIIPNPKDGTIWTTAIGYPSAIKRLDPETGMFEIYTPPAPGHGARGIDVDTKGNIWTCLGGSGHVAKFDRKKCKQTWGTGDQCPEGWTMWETPGPQMIGVSDETNEGSADFHYYNWVDQFDTLGLGKNTVICNGTGSDSLLAFNPKTEKFTIIRMPYPLGFFQRGLDGRIDDPNAGWKGKGLWVDYGGDPAKHVETKMGQICKVQLRPDPLAH